MPHPPARRRTAVTLIGLSLLAVAACGGANDDKASGTDGSTPTATGTDAVATTRTVEVTLTSDGCPAPEKSYPAGALTFEITNQDATAVSEFELLSGDRILGEKENLPPGFSGSIALQLDAGTYTMYCPGAATDRSPLVVVGSSRATTITDTQGLLTQGTRQYAVYVTTQSAQLVQAVRPLVSALEGHDLKAAQDAYKRSRSYYEHIEPVAESFTVGKQNLDANIDARAGDVPTAEWRGFHYIEKGLFEDKSLTGLAPYGNELLANVQRLHTLVKGLSYQPAELANGAVGLLDEVAKSKITGEEERYSHIDLLDFQANVEGSQQAFACLRPGLAKIDPALAQTISRAFAAMQQRLDVYRDTTDPSGFVLYGELSDTDKTALSQALQAVAEPLSRVAGKVVNG
jgi:iron uptake system component EfeO